jgi:hypothetical protein
VDRLRRVEEKLGIDSPEESEEVGRLASEVKLFDEGGGI